MSRNTGSITLEDVARHAGVSRATASRVVRGDAGVVDDKIEAVRRAVAELGYVPNQAARQLVTRRTDTIALMVPEPDFFVFTDPFFARIAISVSRTFAREDVQLVTAFAHSAGISNRAGAFLRDGRVDGAIIVSHHRAPELMDAYLSSPIPIVFVGRPFVENPPKAWVDVDNVKGGVLAARRLLEAGVRHPAIITGTLDIAAADDRLQGFRAELAKTGITPVEVEGHFTSESGEEAGKELLPAIEAGAVDGVFISSDPMAFAAMRVWQAAGIRIPEDLRVVGFDDVDRAVTFDPPLTTLVNPAEELGSAAARMIREIAEGTWDGEPVMLDTRLVERRSC